jgi:aldehyde dehydrogenase (NAD+)
MATVLTEPQSSQTPIKQTKILINNKWVDSVSGKTFETHNPATGDLLASVAEADAADVDLAVKAARKAFHAKSLWRRMSASDRGKLLNKLADLIEENADELALLESSTMASRAMWHVRPIFPLVIACYRYYAGWADKIQGKTIPYQWRLFLLHPSRAGGCCRADHSLELPAPDASVEACSCSRLWQHGRSENGRTDPTLRPSGG